jgi:hypothetical protein
MFAKPQPRKLCSILPLVICGCLVVASQVRATETDQFTVPPRPLKDLGPDVDGELALVLERIAHDTNARFKESIDDALSTAWGWKRNGHLADAAECLTDRYIARKVYEALGKDDGRKLLVALARAHKSDLDDYVFEPPLGKTIYGGSKT